MTITAADIKIGMCIEMDGKTFLVVDFQHCKPGKGPAFVRSKLKNLENGRVLENTFSSVSQKIEQVRVERRPSPSRNSPSRVSASWSTPCRP